MALPAGQRSDAARAIRGVADVVPLLRAQRRDGTGPELVPVTQRGGTIPNRFASRVGRPQGPADGASDGVEPAVVMTMSTGSDGSVAIVGVTPKSLAR